MSWDNSLLQSTSGGGHTHTQLVTQIQGGEGSEKNDTTLGGLTNISSNQNFNRGKGFHELVNSSLLAMGKGDEEGFVGAVGGARNLLLGKVGRGGGREGMVRTVGMHGTRLQLLLEIEDIGKSLWKVGTEWGGDGEDCDHDIGLWSECWRREKVSEALYSFGKMEENLASREILLKLVIAKGKGGSRDKVGSLVLTHLLHVCKISRDNLKSVDAECALKRLRTGIQLLNLNSVSLIKCTELHLRLEDAKILWSKKVRVRVRVMMRVRVRVRVRVWARVRARARTRA